MRYIQSVLRRRSARFWSGYLLYIIGSQTAAFLCELILLLAAPQLFDNPTALTLLGSVPTYLFVLPPIYFFLRSIPHSAPQKHRLTAAKFLGLCAVTIFLMEAGSVLGTISERLIDRIPGLVGKNVVEQMLGGISPGVVLILVVILAPILEELFFRKLFLDRLGFVSRRVAVIACGLAFGLLHGNVSQFYYAFFMGCLFAAVYLKTGKLHYTVLLHAVANFCGGFMPILLDTKLSEETQTLLQGDVLPEQLFALAPGQREYAILSVVFSMLLSLLAFGGMVLCAVWLCRRICAAVRGKAVRNLQAAQTSRQAFVPPEALEFDPTAGAQEALPLCGRRAARVLYGNVGFICYVIICLFSFLLSVLPLGAA